MTRSVAHTPRMRWLGRLLLLRILPRRLVPLFAAWDVYVLLRELRRGNAARRVGPDAARRVGPPPRRLTR